MTPRVSVLMSVYNGGQYLSQAVESVLASETDALEFVIVDNASTDGSRAYLGALADRRIRLVENARNIGQTAALNVGLRACTAPIVARLDADDVSLPDRLPRQLKRLEEDARLALVGGQAVRIDAENRRLNATRLPCEFETIRARMLLQNCFVHSAVAFRREAALAAGGYPADFVVSQDFALFSAFLRAGHRLENLHEPVCLLRTHPEQVMALGGSEKEVEEGIRVAAANQAWACGRPEDVALARTLNRLWSGRPRPEAAANGPSAAEAVARFFAGMPGRRRDKAWLALLLLAGPCDGRAGLRLNLLQRALTSDPGVVLHREFAMRLLRVFLPNGKVGMARAPSRLA